MNAAGERSGVGYKVHARVAATRRFCQPCHLRGVAVCQWLVGVQVAVAFRMMRARLRAASRSGTAGDAADEQLRLRQSRANQRYRGKQRRRCETARMPDVGRIDRADMFGLADLYQLRGRVGRAGHRAYAILMLPRHLLSTGDARKRINAIKQYSSLGSGFKIAMRDLEIRGAGNLLGTQQSGHIVAVGFDLFVP